MPGMWELPEIGDASQLHKGGDFEARLTARHSITVTDYKVTVWHMSAPQLSGKWIPVERLNSVALTGLARKILSKTGVLRYEDLRKAPAVPA